MLLIYFETAILRNLLPSPMRKNSRPLKTGRKGLGRIGDDTKKGRRRTIDKR